MPLSNYSSPKTFLQMFINFRCLAWGILSSLVDFGKYFRFFLSHVFCLGIFIALLLRFDKSISKKKESFPKRFFHASCIAYILGLATTIFVMHTFQAAQPALLYLVPFCIGSSLIVGFSTGKMKELFKYDEESQGEKDKKKE